MSPYVPQPFLYSFFVDFRLRDPISSDSPLRSAFSALGWVNKAVRLGFFVKFRLGSHARLYLWLRVTRTSILFDEILTGSTPGHPLEPKKFFLSDFTRNRMVACFPRPDHESEIGI